MRPHRDPGGTSMVDNRREDEFPEATVASARRTRISIIWIIPLLAALVAVGLAVQRVLSEGPTITIVFKDAAGLEPGKTSIKYKDLQHGPVATVRRARGYGEREA